MDLPHALLSHEHIFQSEVQRVVKNRIKRTLIRADIIKISIKHFTCHEDSGCIIPRSPELLSHVSFSIHSASIKSKFLNQVSDPLSELILHILIALIQVT